MYEPIDQDSPQNYMSRMNTTHQQDRKGWKKWLTPKGWRFWGILLGIIGLLWFYYHFIRHPTKVQVVPPSTPARPVITPLQPSKPIPAGSTSFIATLQITTGFNNNDPLGAGTVKIQFNRDWAPIGYDRALELMQAGFFKNAAFFRVLPNFIAQFGINENPSVQAKWEHANINDDPFKESNLAKTVTFATAGPNTRTSQLFVNYRDNTFLDKSGFTPVGKVIEGFEVLLKLYADYGEGAPDGAGPEQGMVVQRGNEYLREKFPKLSFISDVAITQN